MEHYMSHEISPGPSFPKRGTHEKVGKPISLMPGKIIIPVGKNWTAF